MISDGARRLGEAAAHRLAEVDCCRIEAGLTDAEFDRIESEYGFEFADDHRVFLATGLPVGGVPGPGGRISKSRFPDWRNGNPAEIRERFQWPAMTVLDDVETGDWLDTWGERPDSLAAALETAHRLIDQAPTMVPIFGHRFLPGGRGTAGRPVFSIYGADIICYGADLHHYIGMEFEHPTPGWPADWGDTWRSRASVPFWQDFLD